MKIQPWDITNSRIAYQTPWTRIHEDEFVAHGEKGVYSYAERIDEGPMIIAEEANNKLWLVKQYRHPIRKVVWQFPAEGMHEKETWEEAARRGVREELQREAKNVIDIGTSYIDPGGSQQKAHFFMATGLEIITQVKKHESSPGEIEDLEIACFSLKEIDALVLSGDICDNWTFAGLYLYSKYKQAHLDL